MISSDTLRSVLLVEGVVLVVSLSGLFGHALWLWLQERRLAPVMHRGRSLMRQVVDGDAGDVVYDAIGRLTPPVQIGLFEEIAPNLTGHDRLELMRLAERIGLEAVAVKECRDRRWAKRLRGVRLLTLVGGGEEVVPGLLTDPVAEVRAQAAEWAASHPHPDTITRLLVMLDDEQSLCRFTVQDSLVRLSGAAAPHLESYLARGGAPRSVPGLQVAARLRDARFLLPATTAAHSADPALRAVGAEVLGSIGGEAATGHLLTMLSDTDDTVRAASARALGAMGHWPAAPHVARLLGDISFGVRREAGHSLRKMGAPGHLLLKRALGSPDRFAADTARQMLDIPEVFRTASA